MNIRLPLHILSAATVLLFAATACTQDDLGSGTLPEGEYPLVINATGLQAVATPASTRATVDGDWQGVQTVALSVGGTVKEYDVTASDADGYKTATLSSDTDPFWWTSREDITVSAWWPYNATDMGTMPAVVVAADQSTQTAFQGSDFISAKAQTVQFDNPTLEFSHRTARITVHLKPGAGIPSVSGADVYVTGLGKDNGNPATIRTYEAGGDTYEALTAPQTVKANTPFIQVDLGGGTYYFRPHSDVVLAAGSRYTYTVNVTAKGLELAGCTIGGWTDGGGESGTAEDLGYFIQDDGSYTVYNANGLLAWNKAVQSDLSLNCTLTADINLTGTTWTPIGSGFSSNTGYQGTFDGQGHSITGLSITTNSTDGGNAVLFDGIGSNGTVKNLQVEVNYNVQQGVASGIVNVNYGTITACSVTGDIAARTSDIGGIASINNGSIIGCWFDGNLTTNYVEGGIAAYNYGTITACFYGGNAGQGVYSNQGETAETTKVDNSTVTWQTAVGGMNAALTGNAYQWTSGTDGLPVLKKK
ncbi:fimbrillin family protein [Bacteroides sp. ET71]|uniref:fimbrillin family protein n=1 Tax=Bacteroides sp. ET71 TaxID=2939421 RepID=UPI002010F3B5|nr:fimbrillin family protein [Bacteroides sp. ET71]MCL1617156.1 fimbrillin family protein [Bacteroides sp. ET71]